MLLTEIPLIIFRITNRMVRDLRNLDFKFCQVASKDNPNKQQKRKKSGPIWYGGLIVKVRENK